MIADVPLAKLSTLTARFGDALADDAERCERLLAQACGNDFGEESAALVAAVKTGVAGELLRGRHGSEPPGALLARLCARLEADAGLSTYWARRSVECWALALRIVPENDRLMIAQLEDMALLIEQAGADGALTGAEIDRLITEAEAREISEVEARAHILRYAAQRGWRLPKEDAGEDAVDDAAAAPNPQPAAVEPIAPPKPQAPLATAITSPPRPRPAARAEPWRATAPYAPAEPSNEPPRHRLTALAIAGLTLFGVGAVVVARLELPENSDATLNAQTQVVHHPETERQHQADAVRQRQTNAQRQRQIEVERQQRAEFERLRQAETERSDREQQAYNSARGSPAALREYLNICRICAFASAAQGEIAKLTSQTRRREATSVLCGRPVQFVIDGTGVAESDRSFLGLWTGAIWNSRLCAALIVKAIRPDRTAVISYVYGPPPGRPRAPIPEWKIIDGPAANIRHGKLDFVDPDGGSFMFEPGFDNTLHARFISKNGTTLEATFSRDLSSVP